MAELDNPFQHFRAEHMGSELWRFYVPGLFGQVAGSRPLVIEGGRGSGKTMFFLYNSWRQQLLRHESKPFSELVSKEPIGIYYRSDTPFVTAMYGPARSDWVSIFSSYLSLCLVSDGIKLLRELERNGLVKSSGLQSLLRVVARLGSEAPQFADIEEAAEFCEEMLDSIEMVVGGSLKEGPFRPVVSVQRVMSSFASELRKIPCLSEVRINVFIDEYETLLNYQQRVVNTLIKHSDQQVVFNIGMRPKGMRQNQTVNDSEIIQAPHDFNHLRPERFLDPEGGENHQKNYLNTLTEICRRRLQAFAEDQDLKSLPDEISYYLGYYDFEHERKRFEQAKRERPFLQKLKTRIDALAEGEEEARFYFEELGIKPPVLLARMHLCLLNRDKRYRPNLRELYNKYTTWSEQPGSSQYEGWLHNMKVGLLFLLSREYRIPKLYFGLDVYAMLSSGVVRYFLELCEQAFNQARYNGFNWASARPITPEEQTRAAGFVSRQKVADVNGYEPVGRDLQVFVQTLGGLFRALHHDRDTSLGEPEPNHFCTDDLSLSPEVREKLDYAVMWAVLQDRKSTKTKSTEFPQETVDYHLNHIYCPFFALSYRQKRKLFIREPDLKDLLSGDEKNALTVARRIASRPDDAENSTGDNAAQAVLFDEGEIND